MDQLFWDIPYAFVHLDDVLVASRNHQEHLTHLTTVFEALAAAGLVVNLEKCSFTQSAVEFLGHHISSDGCRPLLRHVAALCDFPPQLTSRLFSGSWASSIFFVVLSQQRQQFCAPSPPHSAATPASWSGSLRYNRPLKQRRLLWQPR